MSSVAQASTRAAPVLVIGGSGRTGRHIVERLRTAGSNGVRVLSRHGGEGDVEVVTGGITRPEAFERVRDVIMARRRGEEALRASGRPYAIVRPSWLTDEAGGEQAIRLEQGDTGEGHIARSDVAAVVVAALGSPGAHGKTFEIYNEPGSPPADGDTAFKTLAKDQVES
jgi:uncharacterized protein YbjT (DUF2867 family)